MGEEKQEGAVRSVGAGRRLGRGKNFILTISTSGKVIKGPSVFFHHILAPLVLGELGKETAHEAGRPA